MNFIQQFISRTRELLEIIVIKIPTSYGKEDQQMWSTWECSKSNVISKEKMEGLENLTHELMTEYCLGTQEKENHTNSSI